MSTVYLNGRYLPAEQATVSVFDRGFMFGDGVYEVIPVFGAHVLRLAEHLRRLDDSLAGINLQNPHAARDWEAIVNTLLEKNPGAENRAVYLQVTRGVAEREHVLREPVSPTVFGMCNAIPARDFSAGISAITHEDIRWQYCHIKVISLLPNVLLRQRARLEDGSAEAILVRNGHIAEGAASNVFVVHGERITTPPKDNTLLPGITRDLVVELLQTGGLDCVEAAIPLEGLLSAGEIWVTSSTMGIAPVTKLDGKPVGGGVPGPVWRRADALYQAFKAGHLAN